MTSFLISSYSLANAPRSAVSQTQAELRDLQKEAVTGRLADAGLTLGSLSTSSFSLRADMDGIDGQRQANQQISGRFDVMQKALQNVSDNAENLRNTLISSGDNPATFKTVLAQAQSGLDAVTGALNSNFGGRFLFSGVASDRPAIAFKAPDGSSLPGYDGSTAQAATDAAVKDFLAAEGKPADAPMTQDDMKKFLAKDGPFDKLFDTPGGWQNFSEAATGQVFNRISDSEQINTAYSASDESLRDMIKSYVMVSDIGARPMDEDARQVLTSRAAQTVSTGTDGVNSMRAEIGASQSRLDNTDETLKSRSDILSKTITSMEKVDPYEASVRVTD